MLYGHLHLSFLGLEGLVGDAGLVPEGAGDAAGEIGLSGRKEAPGCLGGIGLVLEGDEPLRAQG